MSAHQLLGDAFQIMTNDMRSKIQAYNVSLQSRYGDPAVYAAQQEQMAAEQAAVAYGQAKTQEQALSVAYGKSRDRIRAQHKTRLAQFVRDKPPRYLEAEPEASSDPTAEPSQDAPPPPP